MKASVLAKRLMEMAHLHDDLDVLTEGCDCWGAPDGVVLLVNADGQGTAMLGITRPDGTDAVERASEAREATNARH